MSATHGGPAFPVETTSTPWAEGLSKREWFAGQALAGLLAGRSDNDPCGAFNEVAEDAVEHADALLRALAKEPKE